MKTTLRSDRRSLLKKYLTGPTLLDMSGCATSIYQRPSFIGRSANVLKLRRIRSVVKKQIRVLTRVCVVIQLRVFDRPRSSEFFALASNPRLAMIHRPLDMLCRSKLPVLPE